ncbi:UDP-glucose--hexose-1-phosphate uridylyltransferase [Paraferrimonas sp. SM1919]|uniref:UDP-glucose--hexose-1-phosphate uridylyltransferase n=1 Tax=Paraferrimonas sp. SM1919 TaxID=2662263 RepID=UPI0013D1E49F|nr:UDP-glucose--hexose-1-phosphate uridylyltransferase [Paraferrimonas sp. SM1919]
MSDQHTTHRRKNPLSGKWVLVSPHRNNRPWSGATETPSIQSLPDYEQTCPLCPGNTRANGEQNPSYSATHVFNNDFGAIIENLDPTPTSPAPHFIEQHVTNGECRVMCFSPNHNQTLAQMSKVQILAVVKEWQRQYQELSKTYNCVHIFENKGEIMGCSQPHPHGQIWAHDHLSSEVETENARLADYYAEHGSNLLADYISFEQQQASRIIFENESWLVVVPYWAAWPFETLLICKVEAVSFDDLSEADMHGLSEALQILTVKYDNVFNCNFAYSMGWHNAPNNIENKQHWRLHAHFYPPLLRSASIKKHMVGYEMLGEPQRDLTPEQAAEILKAASTTHYLRG